MPKVPRIDLGDVGRAAPTPTPQRRVPTPEELRGVETLGQISNTISSIAIEEKEKHARAEYARATGEATKRSIDLQYSPDIDLVPGKPGGVLLQRGEDATKAEIIAQERYERMVEEMSKTVPSDLRDQWKQEHVGRSQQFRVENMRHSTKEAIDSRVAKNTASAEAAGDKLVLAHPDDMYAQDQALSDIYKAFENISGDIEGDWHVAAKEFIGKARARAVERLLSDKSTVGAAKKYFEKYESIIEDPESRLRNTVYDTAADADADDAAIKIIAKESKVMSDVGGQKKLRTAQQIEAAALLEADRLYEHDAVMRDNTRKAIRVRGGDLNNAEAAELEAKTKSAEEQFYGAGKRIAGIHPSLQKSPDLAKLMQAMKDIERMDINRDDRVPRAQELKFVYDHWDTVPLDQRAKIKVNEAFGGKVNNSTLERLQSEQGRMVAKEDSTTYKYVSTFDQKWRQGLTRNGWIDPDTGKVIKGKEDQSVDVRWAVESQIDAEGGPGKVTQERRDEIIDQALLQGSVERAWKADTPLMPASAMTEEQVRKAYIPVENIPEHLVQPFRDDLRSQGMKGDDVEVGRFYFQALAGTNPHARQVMQNTQAGKPTPQEREAILQAITQDANPSDDDIEAGFKPIPFPFDDLEEEIQRRFVEHKFGRSRR